MGLCSHKHTHTTIRNVRIKSMAQPFTKWQLMTYPAERMGGVIMSHWLRRPWIPLSSPVMYGVKCFLFFPCLPLPSISAVGKSGSGGWTASVTPMSDLPIFIPFALWLCFPSNREFVSPLLGSGWPVNCCGYKKAMEVRVGQFQVGLTGLGDFHLSFRTLFPPWE